MTTRTFPGHSGDQRVAKLICQHKQSKPLGQFVNKLSAAGRGPMECWTSNSSRACRIKSGNDNNRVLVVPFAHGCVSAVYNCAVGVLWGQVQFRPWWVHPVGLVASVCCRN